MQEKECAELEEEKKIKKSKLGLKQTYLNLLQNDPNYKYLKSFEQNKENQT